MKDKDLLFLLFPLHSHSPIHKHESWNVGCRSNSLDRGAWHPKPLGPVASDVNNENNACKHPRNVLMN